MKAHVDAGELDNIFTQSDEQSLPSPMRVDSTSLCDDVVGNFKEERFLLKM